MRAAFAISSIKKVLKMIDARLDFEGSGCILLLGFIYPVAHMDRIQDRFGKGGYRA
jgi:hypothetical protein